MKGAPNAECFVNQQILPYKTAIFHKKYMEFMEWSNKMKCAKCGCEIETIICENCGTDAIEAVKSDYEYKLSSSIMFDKYEIDSTKKKLHWSIAISLVISSLLLISVFLQSSQIGEIETNMKNSYEYQAKLEVQNDELISDIDDKEIIIRELNRQIEENNNSTSIVNEYTAYLEEKAIFLDNNIGLVTLTGEKYHRHGCQYVTDKKYYAYNIELAIAKGYNPCSVCYD